MVRFGHAQRDRSTVARRRRRRTVSGSKFHANNPSEHPVPQMCDKAVLPVARPQNPCRWSTPRRCTNRCRRSDVTTTAIPATTPQPWTTRTTTSCRATSSTWSTSGIRSRTDVFVDADLGLYFEQGNRSALVAPDVLVAFGVQGGSRLSYKIWEEGKPPEIVVEVLSHRTWRKDLPRETGPVRGDRHRRVLVLRSAPSSATIRRSSYGASRTVGIGSTRETA